MKASLIRDLARLTVSVADLPSTVEAYTRYLGYTLRESGQFQAAYAAALDAPALALASWAELGSPDGSPGTVRFVHDPASSPGPPLTTYGWSALEITVQNCDELCAVLQKSGAFSHYAGPADLRFGDGPPGQRAFQAIGPGGELLYLTQILRHSQDYRLPVPGQGVAVGRLFIAVLNARHYAETLSFYENVLGMPRLMEVRVPLKLVNRALNLPPDTLHTLVTVKTEADTLIEIDGYSQPALLRPTEPGHLPSLANLLTLTTLYFDIIRERLETLNFPYRIWPGPPRTLVVRTPGGELIELVEQAE